MPTQSPTRCFDETEQHILALFVRLAALLNLPRSVGEIYGLLFISDRALCLDDCMRRLGLSKGAVSQGLRILRSFGAIRPVYVAGDRRDFHEAETELRRMTAGFITEQVTPQLQDARDRLTHIEALLAINGPSGPLLPRVAQLRKWETRASRFLPLIQRIIKPPFQNA